MNIINFIFKKIFLMKFISKIEPKRSKGNWYTKQCGYCNMQYAKLQYEGIIITNHPKYDFLTNFGRSCKNINNLKFLLSSSLLGRSNCF